MQCFQFTVTLSCSALKGVCCPAAIQDAVLCYGMLLCAVLQRVNRKAMSSLLQSTLEAVVDIDKFPKASVDVNVLVLQVGCERHCLCQHTMLSPQPVHFHPLPDLTSRLA